MHPVATTRQIYASLDELTLAYVHACMHAAHARTRQQHRCTEVLLGCRSRMKSMGGGEAGGAQGCGDGSGSSEVALGLREAGFRPEWGWGCSSLLRDVRSAAAGGGCTRRRAREGVNQLCRCSAGVARGGGFDRGCRMCGSGCAGGRASTPSGVAAVVLWGPH